MSKNETIVVNEIYQSVQGESTWAGCRCVFVRTTFCDLRCSYCDTEYAFYKGDKMELDEIEAQVLAFGVPLVEITGGEPLLQKAVPALMTRLCDAGRTVLIETSGAHDISVVDQRVHRIMDLKTPDSRECGRNRYENIEVLTERDEVKFVIGSEGDYQWAREKVKEYGLSERCGAVLFSPVFGKIDPQRMVEWILRDQLDVRFQLQMHKFIWDPDKKSV